MRDEDRAADERREAADAPVGRHSWTPPRAHRFAISAAEAGGDTSTDGVEILS